MVLKLGQVQYLGYIYCVCALNIICVISLFRQGLLSVEIRSAFRLITFFDVCLSVVCGERCSLVISYIRVVLEYDLYVYQKVDTKAFTLFIVIRMLLLILANTESLSGVATW